MQMIKTAIYQTQQIRELERLAIERFSLTGFILMQRAGRAAFDFMLRRWPQAKKIAVFCGNGNNGGDGFALAKLAHEHGLKVTVWRVGNSDIKKEEAKQAFAECEQAHVPIHSYNSKSDLEHPDLIIDAICGVGVHENLRNDVCALIEKLQRSHVPIFALDLPTGIDADTGRVLGTAVRATATFTFIGLKLGLLTGNGIAYAGEVALNDLQLPSDLFSYVHPIAERIYLNTFANYLKPRPRDWHKGLSGHVLIIGGGKGFSGAARMAAEAALRVGAGLASVATHPDNVAMINATRPEIMCHGITAPEELVPLLVRASVIVLGPGLGQSDWAKTLWTYASQSDLPIVLDADGLNLLAEQPHVNENWVLTPHPGEAARLLQSTSQVVQEDRLEAVKEIAKRYGGVCVLKGAGSLILAPNALPALCDKGNPGMATAGMGDVLSGVIGGLIAQGIPLGDAAKLGVCLHAAAGDLAAKEGERGMLAMDLMPYLRRLANHTNQV